jgi:hypothetical protein
VSGSTVAACGDALRIDGVTEIMPKGIERAIKIYDVGGIGPPYDLQLPVPRAAGLRDRGRPLRVAFWRLTGKRAEGGQHPGTITALLDQMAELRAEVELERFADLKMCLYDDDGGEVTQEVYAKVVQRSAETPGYYRISFTSVPRAAAALLAAADDDEGP